MYRDNIKISSYKILFQKYLCHIWLRIVCHLEALYWKRSLMEPWDMAAKRTAEKCNALTSYTSRKQMGVEISQSSEKIVYMRKKIISTVIIRKAAKPWRETNSIEERYGAITSVGFISARSRSWNKRERAEPTTAKRAKNLCSNGAFRT